MSTRASINHWQPPANHEATELRRLLEERYALAGENVSGKVFEAGCGHGYGTFMLAGQPAVAKVVAVDIDAEAVAIARGQLRGNEKVSLRIADIEQIPVPDCLWMVCTEVMEHLNEAEEFLARAQETIGLGMVLSWPVGKSGNPHHTREFEPGEMKQLMGHWEGEVKPMKEKGPDGTVLARYELGVFRKPL